MIKRLTLSLLNILWRTTAFLVVSIAVLVSVVRLLLPGIDRYREPIAQWVSKQVAQPVDFDSIDASWRGWVPVIKLINVRLYTREGDTVITRFGTAEFSLDPWRSLRRREAVPGPMIVSGMRIALARSEDGSIRLEGSGGSDAAGSGLKQNALAYWLQTQRQLTIEEAAIIWNDERLLKPLIFSSVTLDIRSDGERRQFEGRARLPNSPDSRFRFLLDAEGDLLTSRWSGTMYLEGSGIEPSSLLEYRRWLGLEAQGGRLDFRFWSDWRNALLTQVSGIFAASGPEVGTKTQRVRLEQLRGTVQAQRAQTGEWQVLVNPLQVQTPNGAWPDNRIALNISRPGAQGSARRVHVNVDFLKLDDIVPVARNAAALPADLRAALAQLQPRGNLHNLRALYDPAGNPGAPTTLSVDFDSVRSDPDGQFPGIEGLAGMLAADHSGGHVRFDSRAVRVQAPKLYDRPLALATLQGSIGLDRHGDRWRLRTDGLTLANTDARATVYGELALSAGQAPHAELFARVDHLAPARVVDYLPKTGVGFKTRNWLAHAFPAGHVDTGGIIVRGPLDRFPFDDKDGRFEVRLHVADADLLFSPKWPVINDVNADVVFAGRSITVYAPAAKTMDAEISDTTAFIPDLFAKQKMLLVDGTASGSIPTGKQYVNSGPLKDRLQEVLSLLTDSGKLGLQLSLRIPLYPTPNEIKGKVSLHNAVLRAAALGGDIKSLNGTLRFTKNDFEAAELKGDYAGAPVLLSLKGTADKGALNAEMQLRGRGDKVYLGERLRALTPAIADWLDRHQALDRATGETDWEVVARIGRDKGKPVRVSDLRIHSSLAGMALDLPSPLGKSAALARPLGIHVDLAHADERLIKFDLGTDLNGSLLLRNDAGGATQLARAALQFGDTEASLPDSNGVRIAGTMSELSINDWLDVLYQRMALGSGGTGSSSAPPLPVSVDVTAARVRALGRSFDDVHVRGDSGAQAWQLNVAGGQLEGDITIPHQLRAAITQVNLSRLRIPARAVENATPVKVNPGRLPPVSIRCEDFAFQDHNFGRGELSTRPIDNGLRLESLTFDSPSSRIEAHGEWRQIEEVQTSQFAIRVQSEALAKLLGQFGYSVTPVEGGSTAIDIDAWWGGSPADFTLEKLNGSLLMTIRDGRFLDLDNPAAGRLFGLLSIQALPRRLTLDFNDLFQKGMGFEKITGNFELDGGNAYTNNLVMHGSSARIEITGRTGIAGQDYDQLATVTPQVSDSLPVASALFGPAGAGVGAAIFLGKQIIPELPEQIDKMLARQYTITGSWKDPDVEPVRTSPPAADSPISADG